MFDMKTFTQIFVTIICTIFTLCILNRFLQFNLIDILSKRDITNNNNNNTKVKDKSVTLNPNTPSVLSNMEVNNNEIVHLA